MKRAAIALVAFSLLCGSVLCACAAPSRGSVRADIVLPYVEVCTDDGGGAGTVIRHKGELHILTAAHVVEGATKLWVKRGDRTWPCGLVRAGKFREGGADLALLRPRRPVGLTPAHVPPAVALEWGERLWTIGTPNGHHSSLSPAWCNDPAFEYYKRRYLRYSGDGWYGNSGGGVFARRGGRWVLVGVCSMMADSRMPRSLMYAERLPAIRTFLRGK